MLSEEDVIVEDLRIEDIEEYDSRIRSARDRVYSSIDYILALRAIEMDGRRPLSIQDIVQKRLEVEETEKRVREEGERLEREYSTKSPEDKARISHWERTVWERFLVYQSYWIENGFMAREGIIEHPKGRFKPIDIPKCLEKLKKKGYKPRFGTDNKLILPEDFYEGVNAPEFPREEKDGLTYEQVIKDPLWNFLIPDRKLLKEFAKIIFSLEDLQEDESRKNDLMGLYLLRRDSKNTTMSVFRLCGSDDVWPYPAKLEAAGLRELSDNRYRYGGRINLVGRILG